MKLFYDEFLYKNSKTGNLWVGMKQVTLMYLVEGPIDTVYNR